MSRRHRRPAARAVRLTATSGLAVAVFGTGLLTGACSVAGQAQAHPASPATSTGAASPARRQRPGPPPIGTIGSYAIGERMIRLIESAHTGAAGGRVGPRALPTMLLFPTARTGVAATSGAPGAAPPATTGAAPPATTGAAPPATTGAATPGMAASAAARPPSGPFPLIVFAPGYLQCGGVYGHLLRTWASAGYVVAVLRFPRTNCDTGAAADEADLANQPADVSYVISRLITLSARPRGWLSGLVDRARIAVAGHSDGGDTIAAVAADTCCADHRIAAAIVLAGAEWPPLRGRYFRAASPPMLFVQGSNDPVNPPAASLRLYQADTTGPRYYLDVFGAGHLTPYEGDTAQERIVARVTTEFLDRFLAGQRAARAALVRLANVPGRAVLVSGGRLPPA